MKLSTLGRFLVGDKRAISEIGRTKSAIWIGLLFVISAGFAREYDAEDLLHEPWYLLIPLAASIISSLVLYCLVSLMSLVKKKAVIQKPVQHRNSDSMFPWKRMRGDTLQAPMEPPLVKADAVDEPKHPLGSRFWSNYLTFLTLFWMTAPLAWIYAIPVERLLSKEQAIFCNLWFLGIVSLWRVLLISSVLSVFFRCPYGSAFVVVMLFAATVLFGLAFLPVAPVIVMGGISLPDSFNTDIQVQIISLLVQVFGFLTLPIWLIAVSIVLGLRVIARFQCDGQERVVSPGVWGLALLSLLVWIPILPLTQPEQQNQNRVESLMGAGQIAEALGELSRHTYQDYPLYWDPPHEFHNINDPLRFLKKYPHPLYITYAALEPDVAPWVREHYLQTFQKYLLYLVQFNKNFLTNLDQESFEKLLVVLHAIPQHDYDGQTYWVLGGERSEADQKRLRPLLGFDEPVTIDEELEEIDLESLSEPSGR